VKEKLVALVGTAVESDTHLCAESDGALPRAGSPIDDAVAAPSPLPSIVYSVLWSDKTTHMDLLHSIYRWADAGQEAFFQSAGEPGRVLRDLYLKRAVMRSVTVHVVRGGCSSTLADTVRVRSWISKVGTTSWQSATEILSAARGS